MEWKKNSYTIRRARKEEAEDYYVQNFCPLDKEVVRFTGCKDFFEKEEVISSFLKWVDEKERYFFLIIAPDDRIIGESIINEIDWKLRRANFRIAIFNASEREQGIGTWATEVTRDFAFAELKLHRLDLEVYSFNSRAEKTYLKAGFKREGVLRDAIMDGENYADVILMAILEEDWEKAKKLNE